MPGNDFKESLAKMARDRELMLRYIDEAKAAQEAAAKGPQAGIIGEKPKPNGGATPVEPPSVEPPPVEPDPVEPEPPEPDYAIHTSYDDWIGRCNVTTAEQEDSFNVFYENRLALEAIAHADKYVSPDDLQTVFERICESPALDAVKEDFLRTFCGKKDHPPPPDVPAASVTRALDIDADTAARLLDGEVTADGSIRCPSPGHTPNDRGLHITFTPSAPRGYLAHSFNGASAAECIAHVESRLQFTSRELSAEEQAAQADAEQQKAAAESAAHDCS